MISSQVSPPPVDEIEILLREVVKVPDEQLEQVMAENPWHSFYTLVGSRILSTPLTKLVLYLNILTLHICDAGSS